jgi:hypothetical protein
MHMLIASRSMLGFAHFGRLAILDLCFEAETGSLLLRLMASRPQASNNGLLRCLLGSFMTNEQFTWQAPFACAIHQACLAHQNAQKKGQN